jgi:hypothetical protein
MALESSSPLNNSVGEKFAMVDLEDSLSDFLKTPDDYVRNQQNAISKGKQVASPSSFPSRSKQATHLAPSSPQEQRMPPQEPILGHIRPHEFPSQERLAKILRGNLLEIEIPQEPITQEEQLTADGLQIIAASNFKIARATGDGNCLFTAIAIGLLVRMPMSEIVSKLREAVEKASIHASDIHIHLKAECQELLHRLTTTDTASEIQNILTNSKIQKSWSVLLRGLNLSRQLDWDKTKGPPLSKSMQDHELNLEQEATPPEEYIQLMMIADPPIIWGSSVDVTSLQESLGIRCPWISGQSSGKAKEVVILTQERASKEPQLLPITQLRPEDIVLLFDPASKHFDAAFFLPDL